MSAHKPDWLWYSCKYFKEPHSSQHPDGIERVAVFDSWTMQYVETELNAYRIVSARNEDWNLSDGRIRWIEP